MAERMHNAQRQVGGIYLIGQLLTTGNVINTYTAYNRNTNDVVGLSVLELPATLPPATTLQMLQPLEQRKAVQSPHILRIHDWGIDGTRLYIATDPPRGITLQQVMDNENIDLKRALDMSKQLAQGLKVFHEKGIAGIDLRPQLITIDTVGILDRVQSDDIGLRAFLTAIGYVNLTDKQRSDDISSLDPRYSAPEYIQGGAIGSESDVYQMGLLLFTLITGRLPFVGRNLAETGIMQANNPVPLMSRFNHKVPTALQHIVERAMAKERDQRYPNADVFLSALENIQLPLSAAELMAQSGKQATIAFTHEMQKIDDDILAQVPDAPLEVYTIPNVSHGEAKVYAYLSLERDEREVQRLDITQKSIIVGRSDPKRGYSPDIDLSAVDIHRTVSRQHARIRFEETFFSIEDLKSHNKTRLGELPLEPLKPEVIKDGDMVHFGKVRMRFRVPRI
ncbi:MAG: FHA domain-containing protein [Ktedonobacteraceae bacterium]|nr:FHA domain-containing protein [Ktedonobacteraceae bacterium]